MTSNLSNRDLEALSNYLDGQLSGRQQRKLEARLQNDAGLRQELANLRRTRAALRDLPQVKAPRQFTLTPEMAGQQVRGGGLYPTMRLASALATILFVVVTFGDLITSSSAQLLESAQPVADVVDDSFLLETSTAQDMLSENAAAAPEAGVFEYVIPEEGDAAGALLDAESDAAPATGLEVLPTATRALAPAESAAEPVPAEDAQEEQAVQAEAEEPVAQATQLPPSTPTAIVLGETDRSVTTEAAGMDDSPAPTQGFVAQPPADKGLEPPVLERLESPAALPLIRIIEISLAVLALGLIGFTLYLRRRA